MKKPLLILFFFSVIPGFSLVFLGWKACCGKEVGIEQEQSKVRHEILIEPVEVPPQKKGVNISFFVLRSQKDWDQYCSLVGENPAPKPPVNFEKSMIVCFYFKGERRKLSQKIRLETIEEKDGRIFIKLSKIELISGRWDPNHRRGMKDPRAEMIKTEEGMAFLLKRTKEPVVFEVSYLRNDRSLKFKTTYSVGDDKIQAF